MSTSRVYLSPPHMTGREQAYIDDAFRTNWIAPLGPNVDQFEADFQTYVGSKKALALCSGTAALHLALVHHNIGPGDVVLVSDLTFVASVNPIRYVGAEPVFIDAEQTSWNLDPDVLEEAIVTLSAEGKKPAAVMVVHLYGQTADMTRIVDVCEKHDIPMIEDAAEALGATHVAGRPGTFGTCGIFSFNGNKIITTSGGGMLVSDDETLIAHARKLSTQAREPFPYYEHTEVGFNYRLSNILAGVGRAQLEVIDDRVSRRRANFEAYVERLDDLEQITFQPEANWGTHTRWLTCLTLDGVEPEKVRLALEAENIEARPLWKPMHMQPLFETIRRFGGSVGKDLFARGLCLPSGSTLTTRDIDRVAETVRSALR